MDPKDPKRRVCVYCKFNIGGICINRENGAEVKRVRYNDPACDEFKDVREPVE